MTHPNSKQTVVGIALIATGIAMAIVQFVILPLITGETHVHLMSVASIAVFVVSGITLFDKAAAGVLIAGARNILPGAKRTNGTRVQPAIRNDDQEGG